MTSAREIIEKFNFINNRLHNNVSEIHVKKKELSFTFENQMIVDFDDLFHLNEIEDSLNINYIATLDDILYVVIPVAETKMIEPKRHPLSFIFSFIYTLKDKLCSCPALEFVVSSDYIKIYLDMPNLDPKNIIELNELLESECVIELSSARPYLLYVKDWE